jgi:rhodanese-related sulfurtransferase
MAVLSVTPDAAANLIAQSRAEIVDVRTLPEFRQHHIKGARLLPIQELQVRHGEIPRASPVPLLIVCEHGIRSMAASQALDAAGWANIVNVEGGMAAWLEAGLPVVTEVLSAEC